MTGLQGNALASIKGESSHEIDDLREVYGSFLDEETYVRETGDVALLSSSPEMEQGDLLIGFNGYLEHASGIPEEEIARAYRDHGKGFIENLDGSFRLILYDPETDRIHVSADKAGRKVIYYTEESEDLVCSSHLRPLLRHSQVKPEIDRRAVSNFLRSWSVTFAGGRRLVKGVRRLTPSHMLTYSGGKRYLDRFWEVYDNRVNQTDGEVVERTDRLLEEAACNLAEKDDEPLNIFLSGGFDSVFLTELLSENTEKPIETYTWGWKDEHFTDAEKMAENLGVPNTSLELDYRLPSLEDIWFHEEPQNLLVRYPFQKLQEKGIRSYWTGLNSQAAFPVCLEDVRRLDHLKRLQPVVERLDHPQLRKLLGEKVSYKLSKALSVLSADTFSRATVEDWGLRKDDAQRILSQELEELGGDPARLLDERWGLESRGYGENYSYLQLRVRDTARYAYYSQQMEHFDVFGYTPLLEYSYSLPVEQRKNRRILQKVARGRVPDRIIDKGASGMEFVTDQFRRMLQEDVDLYRRKVERFMERGYLDPVKASPFLLQSSRDASKGEVNQMMAVFLLEQWMEVFMERDVPWKKP